MRPEEFDITKANEWLAFTDEPESAKLEWADTVEDVETIVKAVEEGYEQPECAISTVAKIVAELPVVRDVKIEPDFIVVQYDTTITWDAVEVLMYMAHMEYDSAFAHGHGEVTAKVAEVWRVDAEFWSEVA